MSDMTWREVFCLLDKEYQDFLNRGGGQLETHPAFEALRQKFSVPISGEEDARRLFEQSKSQLEGGRIDELCAFFAKNLAWSKEISAEEIFLCFQRLQSAHAFAEFVSCPSLPEPDVMKHSTQSSEAILRWLLTDYWHIAGNLWTMYRSGLDRDNPPDQIP